MLALNVLSLLLGIAAFITTISAAFYDGSWALASLLWNIGYLVVTSSSALARQVSR
jgi:hypothetical protein